ncbi:MAG: hypothetical protein ACYDCL_15735 [Myxococcales bacterium]
MTAFEAQDAGAVVAAARVREKARALVELWAGRAALELGKREASDGSPGRGAGGGGIGAAQAEGRAAHGPPIRRGARLSGVREHWDRVGFFVFIEPLGNSWLGVDLSPEHPLEGRYAAPRRALAAAGGRLRAEGMAEEGEELSVRVPLPPGVPLQALAEQTFPALWRLFELCHALSGIEDGG